MSLQRDIEKLLEANVINAETAGRIREYYDQRPSQSGNQLLTVFGILGSVLVALGIVLIIAHNWDSLNRISRTILAFLPLIIGQLLCLYTYWKKWESTAWRESSAAFLFISIGACLSLISQIYHIPGSVSGLLLSWMLLGFGLIYLMRSGLSSLLFIAGISWFACQAGYFDHADNRSWLYWPLLAAVFPYYLNLIKERPQSNFLLFHHWFIPLSLTIVLGIVADQYPIFLILGYGSLFGLLYLIGTLGFFQSQPLRNNGYLVIGSLGTVILLLIVSFESWWTEISGMTVDAVSVISSAEILYALPFLLASAIMVFRKAGGSLRFHDGVVLIFTGIFVIGFFTSSAVVLINLLILALGIMLTRRGALQDHLGILNYGLLIIAALACCRFFDGSLTYVMRGIMFLLVGAGFIAANYFVIKKRREHA